MPPILILLLILLNLLLPQPAHLTHAETNTLHRTICLCGRTPAFDVRSPAQREWEELNEGAKHLDPSKPEELKKLIEIKANMPWLFVPPPQSIRNEEITAYYYRFDYYVEKSNTTFTLETTCHEHICLHPKMVARRICGKFDKTRTRTRKGRTGKGRLQEEEEEEEEEVVVVVEKYGHRRHKMCYTIRWKPDLDQFRGFDGEKGDIGLKIRPKINDQKTNESCGKECGQRFGLDVARGPSNWFSAVDVWKKENHAQWVLSN